MEIFGLEGWSLVFVVFFAGISCMVLEVFLPGLVIGIIGAALLVLASFLAYQTGGLIAGLGVLGGSVLASLVAIITTMKILPETPFGKKWIPQTAITAVSKETPPLSTGQIGTALTPLRPGGVAVFEGKRYDVESRAGLIEKGTSVRVVAVEGARIVVEKV